MANATAKFPKVKKKQKPEVIELARQGHTIEEISEQLQVSPNSVAGIVTNAQRAGQIDQIAKGPSSAPPRSQARATSPVVATQRPASGRPSASTARTAPVDPSADGQVWGQADAGTGGFVHPTQKIKYLVFRRPEGLIGTHGQSPTDDDVGSRYGQGDYTVEKHVPGRLPESRDIVISEAFGPPKFPRATPAPAPQERPGRTWPRYRESSGDERHLARPPYRPQYAPNGEIVREPNHGESAVVAMVDKFATLNERTLDRMDRERTNQNGSGNEQHLKDFMVERRAYEDQQRADERTREEARQTRERETEDKRRTESEAQWRRFQEEQDNRHRRDMERIKEERVTLMELEQKKLEVMQEQSRAREELLKTEVADNRERAKEAQESSETRISEITLNLETRLKDERNAQDKQFELRQQAQENEYGLRKEMMGIEKKLLESKNTDEMSSILTTVVEGLKGVINEVVGLKKMELSSAEGQAALLAQHQEEIRAQGGADVNIQDVPATTATSQAVPAAEGSGNGQAAIAAKEELSTMDQMIRGMMEEPFFHEVIKEWAAHVEVGNDPCTFASMYIEWMRDESTLEAAKARKACMVFANFMNIRDWNAMKPFLKPAFPDDKKELAETEAAEMFYEGFRTMVCDSVREYYRAYYADKKAQEEAAAQEAAAQKAPPAQQAVAVVPQNGNPPAAPAVEPDKKTAVA